MSELPKYTNFAIEKDELDSKRNFTRRDFLRLGKNTIITTGIAVASLKAGLDLDQKVGDEAIWPSNGAKLHEILVGSSETYNPKHATFVFGGFGIKDSTNIANILKPSLGKTGRVYGVEYDNSGIDIENLTSTLTSEIADRNLETINLYGHSMGGDIALLVVDELLNHSNDLNVPHIVLDCTPSGIDAVHDPRAGEGKFWSHLQSSLDMYGGPLTRLSVELYNSPRRAELVKPTGEAPFIDISYLIERTKDLSKRKLSPDSASNRLLIDQFNIIRAMSLDNAIENIALNVNSNGLIIPKLTELRPKSVIADKIVQNDIAEADFRAACDKHGLGFNTIYLEAKDIRHADPRAFKKEYNLILSNLFGIIS